MADHEPVTVLLSRVMADVQAVGKDSQNQQQGWSFRGVDAVVNAVGPALREHGVLCVPKVIASRHRDIAAAGSKTARESVVEVEYRIIGPAGDELVGTSIGESVDYSDKGTAQAMSVAYRTWWLQLLCIPTDSPDPDESTVQRAAPALPPDPSTQAWRTLRTEIAGRYPDMDDEDRKVMAKKVWDEHGQDPKRLSEMFEAIPEVAS